MRLRSTIDRRRRRPRDADAAWVDVDDDTDLDDDEWEWEWVEVDEPGDALDGDLAAASDETGPDLLVDPRIAARRDDIAQQRRDRVRRRLAVLVGVLVVVLLAGAVTRSPLLDVDVISVSGTAQTDPSALVDASGIATGDALVGLDLDQAVARIEAEPWVLDATAERDWSGTVQIDVVERSPVATVNAGADGWLVVGGDRRVLAVSPTPPDLPIVDGVGSGAVGTELDPSAQEVIDVARALTPALRSRVAVVRSAGPGDVELVLQPAGIVGFGPATDLDERIRSLQTVFAEVDLVCLDRLDLRVPDAAVLTRVPACA